MSESNLLAGLSMISVLGLKYSHRDLLIITHGGPCKNNKYSGWITATSGRPLINTDSIFNSPKEAEDHMNKVLTAARNFEMPKD